MATQKKKAASKVTAPAVVAKAGKQFAALAEGVPGAKKPTKAPKAKPVVVNLSAVMKTVAKAATKPMKRTVSQAGTTRLSDVPDHEVHGVEDLRAKLAEFPRGALFTVTAPFINIYNLRGRLIGRIKDGPKQKKAKLGKTARADKL